LPALMGFIFDMIFGIHRRRQLARAAYDLNELVRLGSQYWKPIMENKGRAAG
jgi:hypothetical protein